MSRGQIFDVDVANKVYQAGLLFLLHGKVGNRTYKYALIVVGVASRFKVLNPRPQNRSKKLPMSCLAFTDGSSEMAKTAPGWSWMLVYERSEPASGKAQCRGQALACGHPPWRGHRKPIRPAIGRKIIWASICSRDEVSFRWTVCRVG